MEIPMYLNVKIIACGVAGGSFAALVPLFPACGLGAGLT